ncbi:hypothetical protein DFH09DRAFT_250004 [Mycena vulgaris]|nr:hypothetical protein DFH09DRAFT_250004 [Mycena vulgaris]
MHRSLGIVEIVELICAHLQGGYLTDDARKDCAALARTSKHFHGPALDILWSKQDTLVNVLKCLPSNLWEEETVSPRSWATPQFRLIGTVNPADWERPLAYAHRIRELTLGSRHADALPGAKMLDVISSSLPREWLCPNLRTILWEPGIDDSLFPYIRLFLCPNITTAYISLRTPSTSNIALLPALALRYPELKCLFIQGSWESELLRRTSSKIVMDLDRIETLSLDALDRGALEHLSRLPALRSLELRIPELKDLGPPSPSRDTSPPYHPFPSLRNIEFFATTIEFTMEFLNLLSDCHLESLNMGTNVLATTTTTSQFYIALANRLSHTALDRLWVSNVDDGSTITQAPPPGTMANYVISGHTLAPLFCFCNLTFVVLQPPVGFDIDDATAWDIARAWPKINFLRLEAATELHHPPSMTLHGLRAFATHCIHLSTLRITVDASTVPPFDNSPETRISQHRLEELIFAASPISDPPAVARFLSGLFPALTIIDTQSDWRWDEPPDEDDDEERVEARARHARWMQVLVLVPMIAAIRREERTWARNSAE